eukprot:4763171-Heterocapsa_arctica.AAC.1
MAASRMRLVIASSARHEELLQGDEVGRRSMIIGVCPRPASSLDECAGDEGNRSLRGGAAPGSDRGVDGGAH